MEYHLINIYYILYIVYYIIYFLKDYNLYNKKMFAKTIQFAQTTVNLFIPHTFCHE